MAALTVQSIGKAGTIPSYSAANTSDTVSDPGDQRQYVHIKNGGGGSVTATVPAQNTTRVVPGAGSITVPDYSVAIAAGAEKIIGPFPQDYINAQGNVTVNLSGVTSVTSGAFRLPKLDS